MPKVNLFSLLMKKVSKLILKFKENTCFRWKNLENNENTDTINIFADEWEWKKLPTSKGRLYSLKNIKNNSHEDNEFLFWMQVQQIIFTYNSIQI